MKGTKILVFLFLELFLFISSPVTAFCRHSVVPTTTNTKIQTSNVYSTYNIGQQRTEKASSSSLQMTMIDPSSIVTAMSSGVSPEPIHTAFYIANFLPQPFWLLIILLPNWNVTKKIMGGLDVVLLCSLVHFFIVASSIALGDGGIDEVTGLSISGTAPITEFNDVFDPFGDPQKAFSNMVSNYPNFVAEEWSHVLTWDLFIGRYIWLDGVKRKIFTSHSVLFTNLIGPPGLLLHWLTCSIIYKKPLLERDEIQFLEEDDGE